MLAAFRQFRVVRACNTTAQAVSKVSTIRQLRCKHVQAQSAAIQCLSRQAVPHWAQQIRSHSLSAPALIEASDLTASRADDVLAPGLYLVGTPIGNLEDLSVRALRILQNATVILAEDTRHSRKLLNHYGIKSHMYSFHQHNEHSKQSKVSAFEHWLQKLHLESARSSLQTVLLSDPSEIDVAVLRCWSSCLKVHLWL